MDIKFELDKVIVVCSLDQWEQAKPVIDHGVSCMREFVEKAKQENDTRLAADSSEPQDVIGDTPPSKEYPPKSQSSMNLDPIKEKIQELVPEVKAWRILWENTEAVARLWLMLNKKVWNNTNNL